MDKQLAQLSSQNFNITSPKANADYIFDHLDVKEETRQDYKYRIAMFLTFTHKLGINHNTYLDYKRSLASRTDLSISSKNKYLIASRVFLKELNRMGLMPIDITQNVKTFSQDKKHKRDGLNEGEIKRLGDFIRQLPTTPDNARFKAITALLALQGLRQVEIVRLDVKDMDFIANTANILGKGRDDKEAVDLHPETTKALKEYLAVSKIKDGVLFPCLSNNNRNGRLTTRALRQMVKDRLNTLGIDKTVHGFRHFFTTTLIKTYKGDLLEVAQYTRHKSLEMLQIYNDRVKKQADLPRYYKAFSGIGF